MENLKNKAEISLKRAKETIVVNIPAEEIIAIYVKGSYVQNELRPDSDVDVVVILKTEKYLPKVYTLIDTDINNAEIPFSIVAYTLGELQTGERAINRTKNTSTVSIFVKQLDQLPLIYGNKPEGNLFTRTDKKDLTAHLGAFRTLFLPDFNNNKFTFDELVKQVLWLVEREQRALGNKPDYSWQKLVDSIQDKNHIAHTALKFRRQIEITQQEKNNFLNKLETYLSFLESNYK